MQMKLFAIVACCMLLLAAGPQEKKEDSVYLLRHNNAVFEDAAVDVGGSAYLGCTFRRCTIAFTNAPWHFDTCKFESCILRIDYTIHDAESLARIEAMISLLRNGLPDAPKSSGKPNATPAKEGK